MVKYNFAKVKIWVQFPFFAIKPRWWNGIHAGLKIL